MLNANPGSHTEHTAVYKVSLSTLINHDISYIYCLSSLFITKMLQLLWFLSYKVINCFIIRKMGEPTTQCSISPLRAGFPVSVVSVCEQPSCKTKPKAVWFLFNRVYSCVIYTLNIQTDYSQTPFEKQFWWQIWCMDHTYIFDFGYVYGIWSDSALEHKWLICAHVKNIVIASILWLIDWGHKWQKLNNMQFIWNVFIHQRTFNATYDITVRPAIQSAARNISHRIIKSLTAVIKVIDWKITSWYHNDFRAFHIPNLELTSNT